MVIVFVLQKSKEVLKRDLKRVNVDLKMTLNFSKHSPWDIYSFLFNVAFRVVINFTLCVLKLLEADSTTVWTAFVI